jgi:hypothetical protein
LFGKVKAIYYLLTNRCILLVLILTRMNKWMNEERTKKRGLWQAEQLARSLFLSLSLSLAWCICEEKINLCLMALLTKWECLRRKKRLIKKQRYSLKDEYDWSWILAGVFDYCHFLSSKSIKKENFWHLFEIDFFFLSRKKIITVVQQEKWKGNPWFNSLHLLL